MKENAMLKDFEYIKKLNAEFTQHNITSLWNLYRTMYFYAGNKECAYLFARVMLSDFYRKKINISSIDLLKLIRLNREDARRIITKAYRTDNARECNTVIEQD